MPTRWVPHTSFEINDRNKSYSRKLVYKQEGNISTPDNNTIVIVKHQTK